MIIDNHLISIFNDSLVYIYYNFSRLSKWIQYMRSSLCILLINRRVYIQYVPHFLPPPRSNVQKNSPPPPLHLPNSGGGLELAPSEVAEVVVVFENSPPPLTNVTSREEAYRENASALANVESAMTWEGDIFTDIDASDIVIPEKLESSSRGSTIGNTGGSRCDATAILPPSRKAKRTCTLTLYPCHCRHRHS